MSAKAWRRHVSSWLDRSSPDDILNADIFFDLAPVHGEQALARDLRRDAIAAASQKPGFLALLALETSRREDVLGWFGRFATDEQGRVDLKKAGLMPIFSSARAAALRHGLIEKSTPERLAALSGKPGIADGATAALTEAHRILMGAILTQQLRDIAQGIAPSSRVAVKELPEAETERLRWALNQVKRVSDVLGDPVG
jgi:signal-transduction protein with cAMP-binding, CBS, and nucleotidyltransferase domain